MSDTLFFLYTQVRVQIRTTWACEGEKEDMSEKQVFILLIARQKG